LTEFDWANSNEVASVVAFVAEGSNSREIMNTAASVDIRICHMLHLCRW
jgi:hypothetical protein